MPTFHHIFQKRATENSGGMRSSRSSGWHSGSADLVDGNLFLLFLIKRFRTKHKGEEEREIKEAVGASKLKLSHVTQPTHATPSLLQRYLTLHV